MLQRAIKQKNRVNAVASVQCIYEEITEKNIYKMACYEIQPQPIKLLQLCSM